MTLEERINLLLAHFHLSKNKFAQKVGTSSAVISNISIGKSAPSYPVLVGICEAFPEVNARWLITGEGEPIINHTPKTKTDVEKELADLSRALLQVQRKQKELEEKFNEE